MICCDSFSQLAHPIFKHFSTESGLPSSQVYQVLQDKKGYLWFATDHGLSRYNGYEYTNYSSANGLTDNTIFKLQLDKQDRVWMQSFSGQIFYMENGTILPFKYNSKIKEIVGNNVPLSFYIDENYDAYFTVSYKGAYKVNNVGLVTQIFKTSVNDLNNRIYFYEVNKGSFISVGNTNFNFNISSKLYFANKNSNFDSINLKSNLTGQLYPFRTKNNKLLLSLSKTLCILENKKLIELCELPDFVSGIFEDKNSSIWIATYNGVYKLDSNFKIIESFLTTEFISSIVEDFEGGYWFTTINNGVFYYSNLIVRSFIFDNELLKEPLCIEHKGKSLVAGFWNGKLVQFNNAIQKPEVIYSDENYISNIYYDEGSKKLYLAKKAPGFIKNNRFYSISSRNNLGLKGDFIKRKNGRLVNATIGGIFEIENDSISLSFTIDQRANCIFENRRNQVLLGCNTGLFLLNDQTKKLETFDKRINDLRIDKVAEIDTFLCLATRGRGVLILAGDSIIQIDEKSGLCNSIINNLTVDKNLIFCASYNGVSKIEFTSFNPFKYSITNIGLSEGLPDKEINDLIVKDDTLWVASKKAISIFPLNESLKNFITPKLNFTFLNINSVQSSFSKNVKYSHQQNNFSIGFEAISYKSLGRIFYRILLINDNDTFTTITTNRQVEFLGLKPGNYSFFVSAMNTSGVWSKDDILFKFEINSPFWEKPWFIVGVIVVFSFVSYFIFTRRINRIRKEESLQTDFNKQLVMLEMKALRAQMNPHFIFNVINSIQDYILKNDARAAQRYLSKFAKLIRSILDNSVHGEVFLEDELKAAELYVELEQQRFEDKFDFDILISEDVDSGSLLVPSMILQPFLENAIKHGISNLQSKGKLSLKVFQNDTFVKVLISDNGIGRAASADINRSSVIDHISYGSLITTKRVEAYNKAHNTKIDLRVIDLYDEGNVAAGTLVSLEIPLKYVSNSV